MELAKAGSMVFLFSWVLLLQPLTDNLLSKVLQAVHVGNYPEYAVSLLAPEP